jgi:hypothetical protein
MILNVKAAALYIVGDSLHAAYAACISDMLPPFFIFL